MKVQVIEKKKGRINRTTVCFICNPNFTCEEIFSLSCCAIALNTVSIIQGVGCTTIAKELTDMKYKTPTGKKKWHESTIRGILKNEKYKGDYIAIYNFL